MSTTYTNETATLHHIERTFHPEIQTYIWTAVYGMDNGDRVIAASKNKSDLVAVTRHERAHLFGATPAPTVSDRIGAEVIITGTATAGVIEIETITRP